MVRLASALKPIGNESAACSIKRWYPIFSDGNLVLCKARLAREVGKQAPK